MLSSLLFFCFHFVAIRAGLRDNIDFFSSAHTRTHVYSFLNCWLDYSSVIRGIPEALADRYSAVSSTQEMRSTMSEAPCPFAHPGFYSFRFRFRAFRFYLYLFLPLFECFLGFLDCRRFKSLDEANPFAKKAQRGSDRSVSPLHWTVRMIMLTCGLLFAVNLFFSYSLLPIPIYPFFLFSCLVRSEMARVRNCLQGQTNSVVNETA